MKNAGMAGAVALVGVGLITIGLSQNSPPVIASAAVFEGNGETACTQAGCPTTIFDPTVVLLDLPCPSNAGASSPSLVSADLLGLGYEQAILLPSRKTATNPSNSPMQVYTKDGILGLGFELVELAFGDWDAGSVNRAWGYGLVDMDGDGRLDLLVAARDPLNSSCYNDGAVRHGYLRNIYDGPARLPADLDGDGHVDGADLGELFSQWTG